jgi:hypothetical protein
MADFKLGGRKIGKKIRQPRLFSEFLIITLSFRHQIATKEDYLSFHEMDKRK